MAMDKTYTSPRPVYVGGAYYPPGKTFITCDKPSHDWVEEGSNEPIGGGGEMAAMLDARNRIENPAKVDAIPEDVAPRKRGRPAKVD
jgi:hypothetical protein